MTVNELKDYLKKSKSTIYNWCNNGEIPFIKTKRTILFNRDEIDSWLSQFHTPNKSMITNNISKLLKPTRNGDNL